MSLDKVLENLQYPIVVVAVIFALTLIGLLFYAVINFSGKLNISQNNLLGSVQNFVGLKWGGGATLVAMIVTLALTKNAISDLVNNGPTMSASVTLPLLIIAGVTVLVLVLAILTVSFWSLDLSDRTQALALPEGSIRAVISLALVVIFSILATYLYSDISDKSKGYKSEIQNLTNDEASVFLKEIKDRKNISKIADKDNKDKFTVIYYETRENDNKDSTDFAKQLLVLLGTLMTSVTSFYLGSKTSTAIQTNSSPSPKANMLLRSLEPKSVTKSQKEARLKILGDNLAEIKQVKIVNGDQQVICANIVTNDNQVECMINLPDNIIEGDWDVMVTDTALKSSTLQKALKISA